MRSFFLVLVLSIISVNVVAAGGSRVSKFLNVTLDIPTLYGGDVDAKLYVKHRENEVVGPSELGRIVEKVTYRDNKGNYKSFTPDDGDVVLIAREDLIEIITTDMLKAEVGIPYHLDGRDIYPLDLRFRSKIIGKEFRQIKLNMYRKSGSFAWYGQYQGVLFDAMSLEVTYSGSIKKITLTKSGKTVKTIYIRSLTEVSLNDF